MNAEALGALACPVCSDGLAEVTGTLRCRSGHTFDVARHGYVNLLTSTKHAKNADTAEMVEARASFQRCGHFGQVAGAVAEAIASCTSTGGPMLVADIGAGTGYYLERVLEMRPDAYGIAFDISKYAARRSARIPGVLSAVCDTWERLPLHDASIDALLNVFSPRNVQEFARVLKPGGKLVVVTPRQGHLTGVVDLVGTVSIQEEKHARVEQALSGRFESLSSRCIDYEIALSAEEAISAVMMGPSAFHTTQQTVRVLLESHPQPLRSAVAVQLDVWAATT